MATNEARYRAAEQRLWQSVGLAPTERTLKLERTGTTVRIQEVGEGTPVVLVHGASNTGVSWAQLVAGLNGFRSITLDRPGCGLSGPLAEPFSDVAKLGAFADALIVDVLDALELDTAHVVSTSFGGFMALHAAAAHPHRINRVVEMGWTVGAPLRKLPMVMRLAAVPGLGRFALTVMPQSERTVRSMFKGIGLKQALAAGRVSQEVIDVFLSMLRDTDTMLNELKAGPPILKLTGMNRDILIPDSLLGKIRTPIHFLWGEDDPFGDAPIAKEFVSRVPGATLELVPGGHAVWIDDPEHAAKVTREFLLA